MHINPAQLRRTLIILGVVGIAVFVFIVLTRPLRVTPPPQSAGGVEERDMSYLTPAPRIGETLDLEQDTIVITPLPLPSEREPGLMESE
jgi:hypothetical protein